MMITYDEAKVRAIEFYEWQEEGEAEPFVDTTKLQVVYAYEALVAVWEELRRWALPLADLMEHIYINDDDAVQEFESHLDEIRAAVDQITESPYEYPITEIIQSALTGLHRQPVDGSVTVTFPAVCIKPKPKYPPMHTEIATGDGFRVIQPLGTADFLVLTEDAEYRLPFSAMFEAFLKSGGLWPGQD